MAIEGGGFASGNSDTPNLGKSSHRGIEGIDHVREAAVAHAFAHPDAELTARQRRQIDAAESRIIADERLAEPVTLDERMALDKVREGADLQIRGNQTITRGQRWARGLGIGAVTAGIVIPTANAAYESATEVPHLQLERILAESPVELGPPTHIEIPLVDINIDVPTVSIPEEPREVRIMETQEALDEAIGSVGRNAAIAGGTFLIRATGIEIFGRRGIDPVGPTRRIRGRALERQGWRELGEDKVSLKKKYNSQK